MQAPLLDSRTRDQILAQAQALATVYVPGWIPDWDPAVPGDPGRRLVELFARLAELLIERLNRVPQKNFLSFLELTGVERFAGAPARAPVTFLVSRRALTGGIVPAGTQVATTQTKTTDARVFETRRAFFATTARIQRIIAVHPVADRYATIAVSDAPPTAATLAGITPVRVLTSSETALREAAHVLYLGSETLFGRKDAADVSVTLQLGGGSFPGDIVWQRFDKAAKTWVDLPAPTITTPAPDQVRFTFAQLSSVAKTTIGGVEDFWLAAHFTGPATGITPAVTVTQITGSVAPPASPVTQLDGAFYNAEALDITKPFFPFGRRPVYADAFYFGSDTAFSPDNDSVTVSFTIRPYVHTDLAAQFTGITVGMTVRTTARWQYLNTSGDWVDHAFFDHSFQFAVSGGGVVTVTRVSHSPASGAGEGVLVGSSSGDAFAQVTLPAFPDDVGLHELNGVTSRWLRVLLLSERPYGLDGIVTGSGATTRFVGPLFIPPRVEDVAVSYTPAAAAIPLTHVTTLNGFELRHHASSSTPLQPYYHLSVHQAAGSAAFGAQPALYIGFDDGFETAAFISLFFDLAPPSSTLSSPLESGNPSIAWEYWSATGWRPLDVEDDTLDLTTSGTTAFVAPRDGAPLTLFQHIEPDSAADPAARWWLRARLAGGAFDHPPAVRGIYVNTVSAENRNTVAALLVGSSNGEPRQYFRLVKAPVLGGQLWVREPERPTAHELVDLQREHDEARAAALEPEAELPILEVRTAASGESEVWVRWQRVPNFELSTPRSRHYTLDAVAGVLGVGDGTRGLIPPIARDNLVLRAVQTGGGANVNVEAGPLAIKELKTSLPFIDRVFNVQAAAAGASPWTIAQLQEFGPQILKNRGRSVTTEDYEWMVRQRFSEVARVRCLAVRAPGPGGTLTFRAGGVTVLIVPWSREPRPQPSQGLMRSVREFLARVALANIAADIHVKGPDYVAVSVTTTLVATRPELASVVMRRAQSALDEFLHPLTGGEEGEGYGFGRDVYLSEVHAVLERIEEVDHVVTASFTTAPGVGAFPITGDRLASSGLHHITVAAS